MSYDYYGYFFALTSAGRLANFTNTPTIAAYNGRTKAAISGSSYSNIATGVYQVFKTAYADKVDMIFTVEPHSDDQGDFQDVVILQPIADKNTDDVLVDTGTTIPAQIDALQGADSDTLETLSDQMDGIATWEAANISSSITAGTITQTKGDTWSFEIEDLTLDSNLIQLAIKRSKSDTDAESLVFIDTDTGLLYLNGEAATAGDGSLSYAGTTLTVTLKATATDDLPYGTSFYYGIQSITAADAVTEAYGGTFKITDDVVDAVT